MADVLACASQRAFEASGTGLEQSHVHCFSLLMSGLPCLDRASIGARVCAANFHVRILLGLGRETSVVVKDVRVAPVLAGSCDVDNRQRGQSREAQRLCSGRRACIRREYEANASLHRSCRGAGLPPPSPLRRIDCRAMPCPASSSGYSRPRNASAAGVRRPAICVK